MRHFNFVVTITWVIFSVSPVISTMLTICAVISGSSAAVGSSNSSTGVHHQRTGIGVTPLLTTRKMQRVTIAGGVGDADVPEQFF